MKKYANPTTPRAGFVLQRETLKTLAARDLTTVQGGLPAATKFPQCDSRRQVCQ